MSAAFRLGVSCFSPGVNVVLPVMVLFSFCALKMTGLVSLAVEPAGIAGENQLPYDNA
jgi:hypothetical protein